MSMSIMTFEKVLREFISDINQHKTLHNTKGRSVAHVLTLRDLCILLRAASNTNEPLSTIARDLETHTASMTSTVDTLQYFGFIERKEAEDDRRVKYLSIKPEAEQILKKFVDKLD